MIIFLDDAVGVAAAPDDDGDDDADDADDDDDDDADNDGDDYNSNTMIYWVKHWTKKLN